MLVPEFVLNRFENGDTFMAEDTGEVTILLCDI